MSVIKPKTKRSEDHASQTREDPKPSDFAAKSLSNDDRLLMSIRKQIESREKRPKKVELALAELTGESLPKTHYCLSFKRTRRPSQRTVQFVRLLEKFQGNSSFRFTHFTAWNADQNQPP